MKRLKFFIKVAVLLTVVMSVWMVYFATKPLDLTPAQTNITIKPSPSFRGVTQQLVDQEVIQDDLSLILLAKILKREAMVQAGSYTLAPDITPYELLYALNNGRATQAKITFIEGKTFKDMRLALAQHPSITHTVQSLSDADVMQAIGADETVPEGLFFPDTYQFNEAATDVEVLKKAYLAMQDKLKASWENRAADLPYKNAYEALIMASIIEKETGQGSERELIAGVFNNRLNIGMRLQTDPTVIYGMGERFKGNIRKKDLLRDTPYNTYTRSGLPPTPIAMPGLAAIEAALHPADTKALYFVGKGDGTHQFSNTLAAHNRAVRQYQLKR